MPTPTELLNRLNAIGDSLAHRPEALALIGLGSVGIETARLDACSDLDFFVIVQPGYKAAYIQNLNWLNAPAPLAYAFQNTPDGYKALFAGGIFCEFAVFEPHELAHIPFAAGRVVWKRPEIPESIASPAQPPAAHSPAPTVEWQLGEALTNLYVGLLRWQRGEKLSAQRFIQHYAVDRVIQLAALNAPRAPFEDPFAMERRLETRLPALAEHLPNFVQGYHASPQSAAAILGYLQAHYAVDAGIVEAIRSLLP